MAGMFLFAIARTSGENPDWSGASSTILGAFTSALKTATLSFRGPSICLAIRCKAVPAVPMTLFGFAPTLSKCATPSGKTLMIARKRAGTPSCSRFTSYGRPTS
eukprot:Pompholyxophrys_punicea_v1_NODE_32_length_5086_cov_32.566090.p4 type:complete len:104 gc:universal NODE_32_length_5086_cov_32.566090:4515-4826(+)